MKTLETISIGRPVTRGPVTLYPLYGSSPSATASYVPGPVASSRGALRVDEADGGQVPTVEVTNTGDAPVLLIEGELFAGGLQNRVLNVSALLARGASRVPVSCVEANRWSGGEAMRLSDRRAPRRLRRSKTRSVQDSLHARGERHSDQSAVWDAVGATLDDCQITSATADLHSAFDALDALMLETDLRHTADVIADAVAELTDMGPLPGQIGVVVAAGGRCLAADLFDSPDTLAAYWRQIVTSHAFDLPTKTAPAPSIDRALRFVRRVLHAEHTAAAGVGIGTEHHWANDRIVANGLEWDDRLVHLSIVHA